MDSPPIESIVHISDIHIFSRTRENVRHSFDKLIEKFPKKSILVITGDVFEYKTTLEGKDLECFHHMCDRITQKKIKCVIIPGNHDYNDNLGEKSIESGLLDRALNKSYPNIHYFPKTGVYSIDNIDFYVFSPIDNKIPTTPAGTAVNRFRVALLHEMVVNAKFYNNIEVDQTQSRFTIDSLKKYDITCLGDIHKPQFLAPNVGYSGSFVQKNLGEDLKHGYILWDLKQRKGKFISIPLKKCNVKLKLENDKMPDVKELQKIQGNIETLLIEYKNCSTDFAEKAEQQLIKIKSIDKSTFIKSRVKKNRVFIDPQKVFEEFVETHYPNEKVKLMQLHSKCMETMQSNARPVNKWHLEWVKWDNLFTFGSGNFINFEGLNGLTFIIGENKIGKSYTIDIIIWLLYNHQNRGAQKNMLNEHTNDKYGWGACCFRINNDRYIIERVITKRNSYITQLTKNGECITDKDLHAIYRTMKKLIGDYNDFITISVALQNRTSFVDLVSRDRARFICKFLGLDALADIDVQIKQQLRKLKNHYVALNSLTEVKEPDPENANKEKALLDRIDKIKDVYEKQENNKIILIKRKAKYNLSNNMTNDMTNDNITKIVSNEVYDKYVLALPKLESKLQKIQWELAPKKKKLDKVINIIGDSDGDAISDEIPNLQDLQDELLKLKSTNTINMSKNMTDNQ